jgi:hypothetical protein
VDPRPRLPTDCRPVSQPDAKYSPFVSIPMGLAVGTAAFWAGLAKLVLFSTKLTINVMKGAHPYDAVDRMSSGPKKQR